MSLGQSAFPTLSPYIHMSIRQNIRSIKCPSAKCPFDQMSVWSHIFQQNILRKDGGYLIGHSVLPIGDRQNSTLKTLSLS